MKRIVSFDKFNENIEEIIPEGIPEGLPPLEEDDFSQNESGNEEKIQKINNFISDNDLDDDLEDAIVNELRTALLEMEQMGFIDEETTDDLDDKHDGEWLEWIKDVITLPDFPEEGLDNVLELINNSNSGDFELEDEDEDIYDDPLYDEEDDN